MNRTYNMELWNNKRLEEKITERTRPMGENHK